MESEEELPQPDQIVLATTTQIARLQTTLDYYHNLFNLGEDSPLDNTGMQSLNARIFRALEIVTGVDGYIYLSDIRLNMRNDVLLRNLQALTVLVAQQDTKMRAMNDVIALRSADYETNVALLASYRLESLANGQLAERRAELQAAKDDMQDAVLDEVQAHQTLFRQQQQLTLAEVAFNSAAIVELASRTTLTEQRLLLNEANDALARAAQDKTDALAKKTSAELEQVRLQQIADETGIESDRLAAAQALSVAQGAVTLANQAVAAAAVADQKAVTAKTAADAAQRKADLDEDNIKTLTLQLTTAQNGVALANQNIIAQGLRIDATNTNVFNVQNSVTTAQATADNAKAAVTALGNKGRAIIGVAVPNISLLGSGTQEVVVTFSPPFTDNVYAEAFSQTSGPQGLTNYSIKQSSKTVSSFVLVRSNTGTLTLAAPAAVVDIILSKP